MMVLIVGSSVPKNSVMVGKSVTVRETICSVGKSVGEPVGAAVGADVGEKVGEALSH